MIAVDTNVLIRFLTADDPQQGETAERLFETEGVWIAKTVLLETAWVLRSAYGFQNLATRDAFRKLLGLENVHAEDEPSIAKALDLTEQGIDFADAIHLVSCPSGVRFVSFDQALVRRARRAGMADISVM